MKTLLAQLSRLAEHFSERLNNPRQRDLNLPELNRPYHELGSYLCSTDASSVSEVLDALKKLERNIAAGEDGIPPELWIHGIEELCGPLHSLIQTIWNTETIPNGW